MQSKIDVRVEVREDKVIIQFPNAKPPDSQTVACLIIDVGLKILKDSLGNYGEGPLKQD